MSNLNQKLSIVVLPLVAAALLFADSLRASMNSVHAPLVESYVKQQDDNDAGLDRTLKAQYVRLDDQNHLTGAISAIEKETGDTIGISAIEVSLIQKGQVVSRSVTDLDGQFTTDQLSEGNYTLCVSGSDGFLAYGIHIIEQVVDSSAPVPVPAVEADENASANNGTASSFASARKVLMLDPAVKITAAVIPPEFKALNQIMSNFVPAGVGLDMSGPDGSQINVKDSAIAGGFQITLSEDGKLIGRIAPLVSDEDQPIRLRDMNAFLLLDDEIYGRATVAEDGTFEFTGVEPNVYGFAAAGQDGFAAVSFQAVAAATDEEDARNEREPTFQNASTTTQDEVSDALQIAICPAEDVPFLRRRISELNTRPADRVALGSQPVAPAGSPVGGGSFGGGPIDGGFAPNFGGGGGFGGGGAGLDIGGLARAAIGIWALAEIVDQIDDDNNATVPGPVSPFAAQ